MIDFIRLIILTGIFLSGSKSFAETFVPYTADNVPQNVTDLWKDFDARKEPLDIKIIKEWRANGIVTRYITFTVGTFKGVKSRIAAYYSFPDNDKKNPAFVWSHGGGQRAERSRGIYFAKQGYATVDINWLGRKMETDITENTDWGKVDPTQGPRFYSKALRKGWKRNFQPDEFTIDSVVSPRNSNWFLLAVAARRAITVLEQQPEVDATKIGFAGYSMGGMITSFTAPDTRLKAVVPFVGGTGFKYEDFPGIKNSSVAVHYKDLKLYKSTMDPSGYWPLAKIPVMFISSTNDFHSTFERIYKSMHLLPHDNWRVSTNIHDNHGPDPEQWVMLNKWFDYHLKGSNQKVPETPRTSFKIAENIAEMVVTPDEQEKLLNTEIYYSYDPNSRNRCWLRASSVIKGKSITARIKIHKNLPLYTFALCRYKLDNAIKVQFGEAKTFTLNSDQHVHMPKNLNLTRLKTLSKENVIFEDFENGLQDWHVRRGTTLQTYKFQSTKLDLNHSKKMKITLDSKNKTLSLSLNVESKFFNAKDSLGDFQYHKKLKAGTQEVIIAIDDFKTKGNKKLEWSKIRRLLLSMRDENNKPISMEEETALSYLKSITFID